MKSLFIMVLCAVPFCAQVKQELRAVWIPNVASNVLYTDKNIADAMNFLAAKGFNVVFPCVWNQGYTQYPSQIMTDRFNKPINPSLAGRDPLKRMVFEAHRVGIEVIPWFEFGFSSSYSQNGGHIIAAYPQWAAKNNQGQLMVKNGFDWMAGTNPQVQNFMLSIITEVADNYDVDGIQGDDRLPAMPIEAGYDSVTTAIYKGENNGSNPPTNYQDLNWKKWRANKLNQFCRRMKDTVKAHGSNLIFSIAPNPYPFGYDEYLQDAKTWVDSGIVENYIPQVYRTDLSSYTSFLNSTLSYIPTNKLNIVFPGVLTKKDTSFLITPSMLLGVVNTHRAKGLMGESFFFYESFPLNNGRLADTLRKSVYIVNAIPPYRNGKIWRPKATIINEDDPVYTVKSGAWVQTPIQGYDTIVYWTNSPSPSSIEYSSDFSYEAWFDVYAYTIPYFSFTKYARYTLYSDADSTVVIINQQDTKNNGWTYLGSIKRSAGRKRFMKIDNSLVEPGKYIVADAGLYMINRKRSPDVIITDVNDNSKRFSVPAEFNLYQNYPNPFNPSTTIQYSLPSAGMVTLTIYDILGNEIQTLVNEERPAGVHSAEFNADKLSSGVYFYALRAGDLYAAKKMVVVK